MARGPGLDSGTGPDVAEENMQMAALDHGEVVVIGAGVSGLSTAWRLARAGVNVIVVEKSLVGWEASGRNGGAFSSASTASRTKAAMARRNLELWKTLDEELGYPTEYTRGTAIAAMDERELEIFKDNRRLDIERGIPSEILDVRQAREMAPLLSEGIAGMWYIPDGGHANPQRTVQAFAWAIQDLGGRVYQNTAVTGVRVQGDKAVAVQTERGEIGADFVVCAAGPQTSHICEMVGAWLPTAPGRVEIIVTEPTPLMPMGKVSGNGLYGRQTRRGNLAYGGGNQEWIDVGLASPDKPNTPTIRNISKRLNQLYPSAASLRMIRSWGGVVEQTPDGVGVIGTLDQPVNFAVISLSGDGFGISPATGMTASEFILHGESRYLFEDFSAKRFSAVPRDWRERQGWTAAPERD